MHRKKYAVPLEALVFEMEFSLKQNSCWRALPTALHWPNKDFSVKERMSIKMLFHQGKRKKKILPGALIAGLLECSDFMVCIFKSSVKAEAICEVILKSENPGPWDFSPRFQSGGSIFLFN